MNQALQFRQRGVSILGLLFVAVVLAFAGVVGAQAFPTYVEFRAIQKAIDKAKTSSSIEEARSVFDKASMIDDIKSITGKDLEITKNGDKIKITFAYDKEIHMAGPAFLVLKYVGSTN
jgi:sensor histidine kinase regulating citrate/malate metabolism